MIEDSAIQPIGVPTDEGAEAVFRLNTQLRKVMDWLPQPDKDTRLGFYCECGCYESAQLTLAEYDALEGKTVYRVGHAPVEKRFGVVIHASDE